VDEREFDVVVIGAGAPGEVIAGRLGQAGVSVAIVEERLVPRFLRHQAGRLHRADAARRALSARFLGEELHQVECDVARAVLLGKHDDRGTANERSVLGQHIERECSGRSPSSILKNDSFVANSEGLESAL
jgi:choline dehydrogenase-like flavoprotein